MHVGDILIDVQQPGDDLSAATVSFEETKGVVTARGIIFRIDFSQQNG